VIRVSIYLASRPTWGTSKLHSSTPGPIHELSYLETKQCVCLLLYLTNINFILSEWVHQLQWLGQGGVDCSGCRDSDFVDGQFYLHSWPCDLIGHPVVTWLASDAIELLPIVSVLVWAHSTDGELACLPGWVQSNARLPVKTGSHLWLGVLLRDTWKQYGFWWDLNPQPAL
jgi:hypothetical protein